MTGEGEMRMNNIAAAKEAPRASWRWWVTIILTGISVLVLWINGISPQGILWAAYWPAIFVVQLIILTTFWRVVSLRLVWRMFLVGMSIVPAVTFAAQAVVYRVVNLSAIERFLTADRMLGNYDLMAPVVAPFTEEIIKVAPVVLLFFWGGRLAWRKVLGPLDAAILAGASGAGFEFVENLLRVADNNWASLGPDRVVPVVSPHLGSAYLFPDMVGSKLYGVPTVWFGHGEMTATVGLAFGLGLFLRKRFRLWWLIPGLTLLWAMWDHFLVNYLEPSPFPTWAHILPPIDLYGRVLPLFFLAGLVFSIYLANRTQKWYLALDGAAGSSGSFPISLLGLASLGRFRRLRRMVAYGLRNFSQESPDRAINWAAWLATLRDQMLAEKKRVTSKE